MSGPGGYTGAPWSGFAMYQYLAAAMQELRAAGKLKTAAQAVAAGAVLEPPAVVGVSAEDGMVAAGMPMAQRAGKVRVMAAAVSEGARGEAEAEEEELKAGSPASAASGHGAMVDWEHLDVEEGARRRSGEGGALGAGAGRSDLEVHYR